MVLNKTLQGSYNVITIITDVPVIPPSLQLAEDIPMIENPVTSMNYG